MASPQEHEEIAETRLPESVAAASRPLVVWVSAGAVRVLDALLRLCGVGEAWRGPVRVLAEEAGYKRRQAQDLIDELVSAGALARTYGAGQMLTYTPIRRAEDGRQVVVQAAAAPAERARIVSIFRDGREVVASAGQVGTLTGRLAVGAENVAESTENNLCGGGNAPVQSAPAGEPLHRSVIVDRPPVPHTTTQVPPATAPRSSRPPLSPPREGLRDGEYESPLLEAIAERLRQAKQDPAPDVVDALAMLAPNQAAFFWQQVTLYPPTTTSPNYARELIRSTHRYVLPSWEPLEAAPPPAGAPVADDTAAWRETAADALSRAMWGLR